MSSIYKINGHGIGPMGVIATVPAGVHYRLISVSIHFSAAPTTSEDLTITLDANAGGLYDVLLYSIDPSAHTMTDLFWTPDEEVMLEGADAVNVAFPNTDAVTYGVQITMKAV